MRLLAFGLVAAVLTACAPAPSQAPASNPQPQPAAPATPKSITIVGTEVTSNFWLFGATGTEHSGFVDAGLVGTNPSAVQVFPWLAEEIPSTEKGTWTIDAATGTMVTTFHLRPGLVWHDGTPYSA